MRGFVLLACLMWGCVARTAAPRTSAEVEADDDLLGEVTRHDIELARPDWVEAEVAAMPDGAAAIQLAAVTPGATVEIFLGSWCSDSRRELSRLWRAFDEAAMELPFVLSYVAVDRDKRQPADRVAGKNVLFVPTIIVNRGGHEMGRIVESAPGGVEGDLLALLTGTASGVLSERTDLGSEPAPEP